MSYDIQIWSVRKASLPSALPGELEWEGGEHSWVRAEKTWQLIVGPPNKVLPEDVPEDVLPLLPGIQFLTEITLEPISAPQKAYTLLKRAAKHLAQDAHGIILDPQNGTMTSATGVKRYQAPQRKERFSILKMCWWFTEGPLLSDAGLTAFVELLEKLLPEALPRRYGLEEPPQYLFAETGKDHFLRFLHENSDLVWYPHRPALHLDTGLNANIRFGPSPRGFRAHDLTIVFDSQVLDQPGWPAGLFQFWKAVSELIAPFYGDLRILDGYVRMGATYGSDGMAEGHPVKGPWWGGIPPTLGQAVVLGTPYLSLWPAFAEGSELTKELAFLSTDDWRRKDEASKLIGGIPSNLVQPSQVMQEHSPGDVVRRPVIDPYPTLWPFPGPFSTE